MNWPAMRLVILSWRTSKSVISWHLQRRMEIILDRVDLGHSVQIQRTLKVQVQTAEIEVDCTDYRAHIITDKHFGMDEAGVYS